jgi:hypothetical protein
MPRSASSARRAAARAIRREIRSRAAFPALVVACLLVVAGALAPAAVPSLPVPAWVAPAIALAAGDQLEVATGATYAADPAAGRVHVAVDLDVVNRKPASASGGVITRYRYDAVNIAVPAEAVRVRAKQDGAALKVTNSKRDGYRLVSVALRTPLYFRDRASLTVTFDMRGDKPRSASSVRIGMAFLSFPVWAYGDRGTVRVTVPRDYAVTTRGSDLASSTTADGATALTATTGDPPGWYALVAATDEAAMASRSISLAGGNRVLLRGWPEDKRWTRVASTVLADAIPDLQQRIGLPWPVAGTLTVNEVYAPLLEGYAGLYDPATATMTISEQLDRATMIHEASHAWFNGGLFTQRWINEGLAEEYASRVLAAQGAKAPAPAKVKRSAKAAFPLASWPPPAAIDDKAAASREQFGYAAAWTVVRRIVNAAGEEGMRRVFAAAAARTTAYPGAGPAEATRLPNDWRRLVDLAEEVGGTGDLAGYVAPWVLPDDSRDLVARRAEARASYRALLDRGGGWAGPRVVRMDLDGWDFDAARASLAAAASALDARDQLVAAAGALGLTLPTTLRTAYEDAASDDDLAAATAQLTAARDALPALAEATSAVAEPRDWLADFGLGGLDPASSLADARTAWSAGRSGEAQQMADALVARLDGATDAGTSRLRTLAALPAVVAAVLVLLGLVVGLRHRRRT